MRKRAAVVAVVVVVAAAGCKGKSEPATGSGSSSESRTGSGTGTTQGTGLGTASAAPVAPAQPPVPLAPDPGGATGTPRWSVSFGGLGTDYSRAIAMTPGGGPDGTISVAGYFDGEATFGKLGARKAVGGSDVFVAGLTHDGTPTWVQTFGSPRDDVGNSVAVGKDGTTVVCGNFTDALDVGGLKAKAAGSDDLFAAAFDKTGKPLWLWTAGGVDSDGADVVVATPDGGWLIGGSFVGEAKFGATTYESMGGNDAILAKLAPTGEVQWVQQMGGAYNDWIRSLAIDGQGNIYLLAEFVDTARFGGAALPNQGNAGADLAVAKLDPKGKHLWSKSFGTKTADVSGGIAVDPAGDVTVSGAFEGTLNVDGQTYTSLGQFDILAARFDTNGTTQWVKTWGGEGTDIGAAVAVDASGNSIIAGWFEGAVVFGDKVLASKGNRDAVVLKLDPKGGLTWVKTFGDRDHDQARGVAVDGDGNPIVTGVYRFGFDAVAPTLQSVRADGDKQPPKPDVFVLGLSR